MVQKPLSFEMRDFVYYLDFLSADFLSVDFLMNFLSFLRVPLLMSCSIRSASADDLVGIKDILGCVTACVRQGNLAVMLMFQQFQLLQGIHGPVDTWLGDTNGTGNICDAHFLTFKVQKVYFL